MEEMVMNNEVMDNEEVINELVPVEVPEVEATSENDVSTKDVVLVGALLTFAGIGVVSLVKGGVKLAMAGVKKIKDAKAKKVAAEQVSVVEEINEQPVINVEVAKTEDVVTEG